MITPENGPENSTLFNLCLQLFETIDINYSIKEPTIKHFSILPQAVGLRPHPGPHVQLHDRGHGQRVAGQLGLGHGTRDGDQCQRRRPAVLPGHRARAGQRGRLAQHGGARGAGVRPRRRRGHLQFYRSVDAQISL